MGCSTPTEPKSKGGKDPAKCATKKCPLDKYKITKVEVKVVAPDNIVFMNTPNTKILVTAKVTYQKSASGFPFKDLITNVVFSFTDPSSNNTEKTDSFDYVSGSHYLGKKSDPNAKYWKAHTDHAATSDNNFKRTVKATLKVVQENVIAETKVMFIPSGVGGDDFKITAKAFDPDGTTLADSDHSDVFVVWRKIHFNDVYSMESENYIDSGSSVANVNPAFKTKAFVEYTRAAVNELADSLTVKYIGLYKSGGGSKNWPDDFSPEELETTENQLNPTDAELADYNGRDIAKKAIAKTNIEAKAALWFLAIVSDYNESINDWFSDASLDQTKNSLLAAKYYHPKLSGQADGGTDFWPAGITINLANPGSGLISFDDPDKATWRGVQGFNQGKIVVIFKNYGSAPRLQIICRHEIGHATKSDFKRENFGAGDHSASGLMTPYGGSNKFSADDIKKLRGIK